MNDGPGLDLLELRRRLTDLAESVEAEQPWDDPMPHVLGALRATESVEYEPRPRRNPGPFTVVRGRLSRISRPSLTWPHFESRADHLGGRGVPGGRGDRGAAARWRRGRGYEAGERGHGRERGRGAGGHVPDAGRRREGARKFGPGTRSAGLGVRIGARLTANRAHRASRTGAGRSHPRSGQAVRGIATDVADGPGAVRGRRGRPAGSHRAHADADRSSIGGLVRSHRPAGPDVPVVRRPAGEHGSRTRSLTRIASGRSLRARRDRLHGRRPGGQRSGRGHHPPLR